MTLQAMLWDEWYGLLWQRARHKRSAHRPDYCPERHNPLGAVGSDSRIWQHNSPPLCWILWSHLEIYGVLSLLIPSISLYRDSERT